MARKKVIYQKRNPKLNVMIVGGSGYIGSRLVQDLREKYNVINVDITNKRHNNNEMRMHFAQLDQRMLYDVDAVIFLAGYSSVPMCEKSHTTDVITDNVTLFINFVEKIRAAQMLTEHKIKFIYASSSSVYGSGGLEGKEDLETEFKAMNLYDWTKYCCDSYMKSQEDIQYYGLRFGTVNGYSPNTREDIMINSMVRTAKTKKKIVVTNKKTRRPILAISDLVRAMEAIIDNPNDLRGIYNVASFNSTVEQIAKKVEKITNSRIEYALATKTNTKPYDFVANTDKFCKAFNFEFKGTVTSITNELLENYKQINFITRNRSALGFGKKYL